MEQLMARLWGDVTASETEDEFPASQSATCSAMGGPPSEGRLAAKHEQHKRAHSNGSSAATSSAAPVRVLIVQACPTTQAAMLATVETISNSSSAFGLQLQLEVSCANTGEVAWDMLTARRFDIALVDVDLPGVSGLDLAWCYQQSVSSRGDVLDVSPTVMIACSREPTTEPTDEEEGKLTLYESGMRDVLSLPLSTSSLRHMLHKWLPRRTRPGSELNLAALVRGKGPSCVLRSRVLLVESCGVTAAATACLLQELGMWIDTAEDGETAMTALSGGRIYDLVLLEVNLPAMSGYALCSWCKDKYRQENRRPPLFVAVTADPDVETCRSFDIDRCLPKPLTNACAKRVLKEWLASASSSQRPDRAACSFPPREAPQKPLQKRQEQYLHRRRCEQQLPPWWRQQQDDQLLGVTRQLSEEQKAAKLQKQAPTKMDDLRPGIWT